MHSTLQKRLHCMKHLDSFRLFIHTVVIQNIPLEGNMPFRTKSSDAASLLVPTAPSLGGLVVHLPVPGCKRVCVRTCTATRIGQADIRCTADSSHMRSYHHNASHETVSEWTSLLFPGPTHESAGGVLMDCTWTSENVHNLSLQRCLHTSRTICTGPVSLRRHLPK